MVPIRIVREARAPRDGLRITLAIGRVVAVAGRAASSDQCICPLKALGVTQRLYFARLRYLLLPSLRCGIEVHMHDLCLVTLTRKETKLRLVNWVIPNMFGPNFISESQTKK